jgi:transposase
MPMLADRVDVVIGVDTHTAALVDKTTGGLLARHSIPADADGYDHLRTLASEYPGRRVWALEGSGSYGAGLARALHAHGEWVVELDRPKRPARRHGAKSDPIDAVRAARDALARPILAQPQTADPGVGHRAGQPQAQPATDLTAGTPTR